MNAFRSFELRYPGATIDPESRFTPFVGQYLHYQGRAYGMFPPVFILVSAVPYHFLGDDGLTLVPSVSTIITILLCGLITLRISSRDAAVAVMILLGLASPLLFYAMVLWEHAPSVALVMAALYLVLKSDGGSVYRPAIAAGLCMGVAAWFRNGAILAAPALTLSIFIVHGVRRGMRSGSWMAGGVVAALIPFAVFNSLQVGSPLGAHAAVALEVADMRSSEGIIAELLSTRQILLEMLLIPFRPSFVGTLTAVSFLLAIIARSSRSAVPHLLVLGSISVLAVLLFPWNPSGELATSLLATFPVALLVLMPGAAEEKHPKRLETERLLLWYSLLFVLLIFFMGPPPGGAQWGPRFLLPAIPPLGIVAVTRTASIVHSGHAAIRAAAAVAMLLVALTGAAIEYYGIRQLASTTHPRSLSADSLEGVLDVADCTRIQGWAWDPHEPVTPLAVEVLADGRPFFEVNTSQLRVDLESAGKGNGLHAFSFETPSAVRDGALYQISAKVKGTGFVLTGSPKPILCPPAEIR